MAYNIYFRCFEPTYVLPDTGVGIINPNHGGEIDFFLAEKPTFSEIIKIPGALKII